MKYYVTARTYSNKGGTLYFFIDGFKKIFEHKDDEEIDVRMKSKLATKKPKGDPEKSEATTMMEVEENSGKITSIHRAVEIEWEELTALSSRCKGQTTSKTGRRSNRSLATARRHPFFCASPATHTFWRLQPE